jgi:beta-lactamase regulating signal transducer with metallopeptidase domain
MVLLVSLLKASLVLALAQLIASAVRSLSAAAKHLLLTAGLAAFLLMPLFAWLAPAWSVKVETLPDPVTLRAAMPLVTSPPPIGNTVVDTPRALSLGEAAALLWLLGAGVVFLHLIRSAMRVRSIVAGAVPPSARLTELLAETRARLAIAAPVRLFRSDRIHVPMVWGVRSGTLLLPEVAEEWPDEHLRATFIHELGHLQRLDYVSLTLMNLVSALLWWQPQVWLARRQALMAGERACDDLVLRAGERASAYAMHLLHVAGMTPRRESLSALLAMSRPSQLEGRMQAILSTSVNRQTIGGKRLMISLVSFLTVVVPLSVMQIAALPAVAAVKEIATPVAVVAPVTAVASVTAPAVAAEPAPARAEAVVAEALVEEVEGPAVVEAAPVSSVSPVVASAAPVVSAATPVVVATPATASVEPAIAPAVTPSVPPAAIPVLSQTDIGSRPFRVLDRVEGRSCTLKLKRPVNPADLSHNPAGALAMQRLLQNAKAQGADAVTNLKCSREIRIGLGCPTAVVCEADAIRFDG